MHEEICRGMRVKVGVVMLLLVGKVEYLLESGKVGIWMKVELRKAP